MDKTLANAEHDRQPKEFNEYIIIEDSEISF